MTSEIKPQEISNQECGVYVHIPFCRKKCLYCDFYSGGGRHTDWERFVNALVNELTMRKEELDRVPSTLYIGGGTPSLMPVTLLSRLVDKICRITGKTGPWAEFTIEVNPEDVSQENCDAWKACGVNRVSMGVQTLNDIELKRIGRNHNAEMALNAIDILRRNFDNYSVDLIFGLPEQSLESFKETVEKIISIRPPHISAYSLMFEEGTAMTLLREQGRMKFPSEEECVEMWNYLQSRLKEAGYLQYELSNYSLPGRESLHNRRYWLGNPYLGLGPSAHSYDGNRIRRANRNDIKGYMDYYNTSEADATEKDGSFYAEERLTEEELIEERIMLSMRMTRGLNLKEFANEFGRKAYERLLRNVERMVKQKRVEVENDWVRLRRDSVMVSDEVILELCM